MRKRYLAGVAAMAAATLAFSGCGGSTNPSASASAPGSAEAVTLLSHEDYGWFFLHLSGHLGGSLVMTILGIYTVRALAL